MAGVDGPCPVCGYDPSLLTPPDAAVAVRSYPRRFRELFAEAEAHTAGITTRVGRDEESAVDHAAWVAAVLAAVERDLERVAVSADPAIDPPPLDGRPPSGGGDPAAALAALAAAAGGLAGRIEAVTGEAWKRTGHDPSGATWTALDLVKLAVHAGVHHLRLAERALAEARG